MDANTGQTVLSRGLPKTGQSTVYRAGDNGTHQAGWWQGLTLAGNKTRFVAETINGDDVITDKATGLMWAKDGNGNGGNSGTVLAWNDAIDYANALTFAGFTDWRMPNIFEMFSIVDISEYYPPFKQPPFANMDKSYFFSSTTFITETDHIYVVSCINAQITIQTKVSERNLLCVRGGV